MPSTLQLTPGKGLCIVVARHPWDRRDGHSTPVIDQVCNKDLGALRQQCSGVLDQRHLRCGSSLVIGVCMHAIGIPSSLSCLSCMVRVRLLSCTQCLLSGSLVCNR